MRDYYEILMVHEEAIPEVIDRVYRFLARRYHPDVHPPEEKGQAERRMTEINLAYQVLSDPKERAEYDQQRRLGIPATNLVEDTVSVDSLLKCFNHPRRAAAAFCWDCGRPICTACVSPESFQEGFDDAVEAGRTICSTCVHRSTDLETRIRAGRRAKPEGGWLERPMGRVGTLLYYAALGVFAAGLCAGVFWAARAVKAEFAQARLLACMVGGLYVLLIAVRLFQRVRCPNCGTESGRVDFRRIAPWKDMLRPHPVCSKCGRHFLRQEVSEPLE